MSETLDRSVIEIRKNRNREKLLNFIYSLSEIDFVTDALKNIFTDERDGRKYKFKEFNNQLWMTENLDFDVGKGCCAYKRDIENRKRFGLLYNWKIAKTVCPLGWKLPLDIDWNNLLLNYGGYQLDSNSTIFSTIYQAISNKTNVVAANNLEAFRKLIEFGDSQFNANFGGWKSIFGFHDIGNLGMYWAADTTFLDTYFYSFDLNNKLIYKSSATKNAVKLSCRCIKE